MEKRRRGGGSVLQPQLLSVSPEEEQRRDIDKDSDVDSKKEPDWQKSLIAVTTEKDYVKLSKSHKQKIYPINIELHLSKKEKLLLELKKLVF